MRTIACYEALQGNLCGTTVQKGWGKRNPFPRLREAAMVRFTVHNLGEHSIENMVVSGPFKEIVMSMADMFLAGYSGPSGGDLDIHFAQYIISMSLGQGTILEYSPPPAEGIN